jgi:hypothetical protein
MNVMGHLATPLAISAFGIGGFALLYVLVFLFLGIRSIKHGHWIMFLIGIPIPDLLDHRGADAARPWLTG